MTWLTEDDGLSNTSRKPKITERVQRIDGKGSQGLVVKLLAKRTKVVIYWGTADGVPHQTTEAVTDIEVVPSPVPS